MAEIINLNRARKAKKRVDDKVRAEANRAGFGRTKAEKLAADKDRARIERTVDGAKLDDI